MTKTSPYSSKIKIYLDGADRSAMIEMASNPLIQGFTTNPSLVRKAGVKDYSTFCKETLQQVRGKPISFEVFADEFGEMKRQALEIASWYPGKKSESNIYVKIPVINSQGMSCAPLIADLSRSGVKLNVTALYSVPRVLDVCQALKGGAPSFVSVFAGRIADIGRDPIPLMGACWEICTATDPNIELLWASTREAFNIVQAEMIGCHIITAPLDVIKKVPGFGKKTLEQLTLETVQTFKTDAEAAGFSL